MFGGLGSSFLYAEGAEQIGDVLVEFYLGVGLGGVVEAFEFFFGIWDAFPLSWFSEISLRHLSL